MADGALLAPFLQALDASGAPISGAKLKFYLSETTTPTAVYSTPALDVSLGATITADSSGRFDFVWGDAGLAYKAVLTDAADVVIDTIDPVNVATNEIETLTNEQSFTGDASTVAFTLAGVDASSAGQILVHIDGAYQPISGAYTVASDRTDTVVTFSAAPPSGAVIRIRYLIAQGTRGETGPPAAITFTFDSSTTDADPGDGEFRLNHATPASATQLFIDNLEYWGGSVAAWLSSFDDSTSTSSKGTLIIHGVDSEDVFAIYRVTAVADGGGYKQITMSYVTGAGAFVNGEMFTLSFYRVGDKGDTGAGGATYATTFGDGAAASFVITHNLGSRAVQAVIYRNSSPYDVVYADVEHTDANSITIRTTLGTPTLNQFAVAVLRTS